MDFLSSSSAIKQIKMALLFTLPLEIRLFIIDLVLNASREVAELSFDNYPDRMEFNRVKHNNWYDAQGVLYQTQPSQYTPNGEGLLLACRQLRHETLCRADQVPLKLDVVMSKENLLLSTWTCIPTNRRHTNFLEAQIRIHGPRSKHTAFRGGDGGPPVIVWMYYKLLRQFLEFGPSDPTRFKTRGSDEFRTIGILDINVLSPKNLPHGWELGSNANPLQRPMRGSHENKYVMRAEHLCGFLKAFMRNLLAMGRGFDDYGAILHERIGKICFRVDGSLVKEFDLAAVLATLQPTIGPYADWRTRTQAFRKRMVLPVIEADGGAGPQTDEL